VEDWEEIVFLQKLGFSKVCLGPGPDPQVRPWRVRPSFCRRPRRQNRRLRPSRGHRRSRHIRRRDRRSLQSQRRINKSLALCLLCACNREYDYQSVHLFEVLSNPSKAHLASLQGRPLYLIDNLKRGLLQPIMGEKRF
jgi:hypothetical protein